MLLRHGDQIDVFRVVRRDWAAGEELISTTTIQVRINENSAPHDIRSQSFNFSVMRMMPIYNVGGFVGKRMEGMAHMFLSSATIQKIVPLT